MSQEDKVKSPLDEAKIQAQMESLRLSETRAIESMRTLDVSRLAGENAMAKFLESSNIAKTLANLRITDSSRLAGAALETLRMPNISKLAGEYATAKFFDSKNFAGALANLKITDSLKLTESALEALRMPNVSEFTNTGANLTKLAGIGEGLSFSELSKFVGAGINLKITDSAKLAGVAVSLKAESFSKPWHDQVKSFQNSLASFRGIVALGKIAQTFRNQIDSAHATMKLTREVAAFRANSQAIAEMVASQKAFAKRLSLIGACLNDSFLLDDSLTIDQPLPTDEDVSLAIDEQLLSEDGILTCPVDELPFRLKNLPVWCRKVLMLIIVWYAGEFFSEIIKDSPVHPKAVAQLAKNYFSDLSNAEIPIATSIPSLTKRELRVYAKPRRKSRVTGRLCSFQEVDIIRFRRRKRWVLVEWEDENGEKHRGWVLGRYIFRWSGQVCLELEEME